MSRWHCARDISAGRNVHLAALRNPVGGRWTGDCTTRYTELTSQGEYHEPRQSHHGDGARSRRHSLSDYQTPHRQGQGEVAGGQGLSPNSSQQDKAPSPEEAVEQVSSCSSCEVLTR